MQLTTLTDVHSGGQESFIKAVHTSRRGVGTLPTGTQSILTVIAEVNQGRWIARCPFCAGAELLDAADPRFYCLSCYNEAVGHEWLNVRWPLLPEDIETALLARPKTATQNWTEAETVDDLLAENAEKL